MAHFDVIVIGTGGIGSAAVAHLAERGVSVLGLDRFPHAHDRGSSHGQTRIIRQAYFEHSDYVPLLLRAYALWELLAEQADESLYEEVGLLEVGRSEGELIQGVLHAAELHGLTVHSMTADEVNNRWKGFRVPEGYAAIFEPRAGFLRIEACILAYLRAAETCGATLKTGVEVLRWQPTSKGIEVETDAGRFSADRLVITAGPWSADLLASLKIPFEVRRKSLFWYPASDDRFDADNGCPTFFYELDDGAFYGFPQIDAKGVKIAEHTGGETIADPLTLDRTVDLNEEARIKNFLNAHLVGLSDTRRDHAACMYTMSPDEHFVVDRHPEHPQVAFVAGLSGHGFKFASVLGEALADLAIDGKTELPIEFLSPRRFNDLFSK